MNGISKMMTRRGCNVCVIVLTILTAGCAGQGKYASFHPVPRGSTLLVVALEPEIKVPDAKTAGELVGKNVAAGAGVGLLGGLGGGIYLSFMCGPAIIVCAPVLVPAGAAVGLVGGTALGADATNRAALPKEKAEALEAVMSDALREIDFSAALQETFVERSDDRWNQASNSEAIKLTLGVEALNLTQLEDDVIVLNFTASMILQYGPDEGQTTRRFLFSHSSDGRFVDDFLEDDGKLFRSEITAALESTIGEMIDALDYVGTRQSNRR